MSIDLDIAGRLRKARVSAGYESAAEAADALDLNFSTYAGHENGNRGITAKSLSRYAAFFKVNLAWLIDGKPVSGDPLEGLSAEERKQALAFIEYLRSKHPV